MRLFVALDLPDEVRAALPVPEPPWRPVPKANLHVTVVFIGDSEEPPVLEEPLPAAPLRVAETILLPPRRPRVVAVRLDDPTGLHTAFQARLAKLLDRAEDRPWLPHITIGRSKEVASRHRTSAARPLEFIPPSLTLYRTRGGRYEPLQRLTPGIG